MNRYSDMLWVTRVSSARMISALQWFLVNLVYVKLSFHQSQNGTDMKQHIPFQILDNIGMKSAILHAPLNAYQYKILIICHVTVIDI